MILSKRYSLLQKLSFAVCVQLASITAFSTLVMTPAALLAKGIPERWEAKEYQPPAGLGAPGSRQAGGTRDSQRCLVGGKQLTALVPVNNFAVTIAPYPTFFVYMPSLSRQQSQTPVEFVLQDEQGNELYKATYKAGGKSGIVSISLPSNAGLPPLETGKTYRWDFSLLCNPLDRSEDLSVGGMISRVPLSARLSNQLRQAKPENRAQIYAEAEIWQDALTALAEQRRYKPNNSASAAEWKKLLTSVGLADLAREPF